jgi:hypothetical protein
LASFNSLRSVGFVNGVTTTIVAAISAMLVATEFRMRAMVTNWLRPSVIVSLLASLITPVIASVVISLVASLVSAAVVRIHALGLLSRSARRRFGHCGEL